MCTPKHISVTLASSAAITTMTHLRWHEGYPRPYRNGNACQTGSNVAALQVIKWLTVYFSALTPVLIRDITKYSA
jgi:hypothetical protein